jgi:hypothetical protein
MAFNSNSSADTTQRKRPKPVDYDQLYPGRFIKAGELLGKKVTLTITDVDMEDLMGEDGKPKAKATVAFKETEKQLVMCKTNGLCLKGMFGKKLSDWIGKRVTLFPDTWNNEPATRVWGSPDIAQDIEVEVSLPRRRPFKKTMHAMGKANGNGTAKSGAQAPAPDPAAWVETLNGQESTESLEEAWAACKAAFNGAAPNECDSAYQLRKEALTDTVDL